MLDPNQPSAPEPREDRQPVATQGEPILLTPQGGVDHGNAPFTVAADHADADATTNLPARRPRRRAVGMVLAGVVTLVVLAGGAVATKMWYGSTGALPEGAVPASTAAFLRINLSPGYSQRVKMLALLKKFPKAGASTADKAGSNQLDTYKQSLVTGLDLGLSFNDVKGWLGDRAGVGAWADSQGRPVVLAAVASGDDAAARKQLGAARDRAGREHLGFVVSGGYALLAKADTGAQAAADEAARAATKASLADDRTFRAAVATLPADQALLAWADLGRVGRLLTTAAEQASRKAAEQASRKAGGPAPDFATVMPGLAKLTGVVVTGAQAVDNGIEIHSRSMGVKQPAAATIDAKAALDAMPGNAAFAAATGGLGADGAGLGPLGPIFTGGLLGMPGPHPATGLGATPGGEPSGLATGPVGPTQPSVGPDGKLHVIGPDGKELVIDPNDPSTFPTGAAATAPTDLTGGVAGDQAFGNAWNAIVTALGAARSIGVALTGVPAEKQALPPMMLTVGMGDDPAATALVGDVNRVATSAGLRGPGALTVTQHGDTVQVRTPGFTPADGTLAGNALFTEAMAGAPAAPTGAAFIDVRNLQTTLGASAATITAFGPVKAVGITTARSGDDGVALIRIVIR